MKHFVPLRPKYAGYIQQMHDTKIMLNNQKLTHYDGAINTDDHGFIVFEDFTFAAEYPEGTNILSGPAAIGKNLRRFFNEMPVYIHPQSALTGAWAGVFQRFVNIGYKEEDKAVHLQNTHKKYGITQSGIGGMNHNAPDMKIVFQKGFFGILEEIRFYRAFNKPANTDFYDGHEAVALGMLEYIEQHRDYALALAEKTADPDEKANYQKMAEVNTNLLTQPPRTFREACQAVAVFQSADRTYFAGGALGQLDELLRPFYEKDIAAGILSDDEAVWIIASLFYNDTHYSQLGGQTPDGTADLTSKVSYLILQAAHTLNIPYNLAVRVYEGGDDSLVRASLECILEKGSGPAFSLAKGIEEGFIKQGHPAELARMRAKVGCNWVALPGTEYPLQDVTRLNLGMAFLHSFHDMMAGAKAPSLDILWQGFRHHLKIMVDCIKEGYDWHYETVANNTPEMVMNLFSHGPMERGVNCSNGGVDIINLNLDGIALATVADSFAAIGRRVVEEKMLSWDELAEALENNFEDENIRLMLHNIDRYGSPDSAAQDWAIQIRDAYVSEVNSSATPKHKLRVVPGLFSHGDVYAYGKILPATPNGRRQGDPISHSGEPDPGFARGLTSFSPTLKANAVAATQPGWGNSSPLHLDIDSKMVLEAGGVDTLVSLVYTHNEMGGTLINMNCLTEKMLREAHENPQKHPDLVVRVTGYSAFFSSLSKEYRQQVVDRYLTKQ